MTILKDDFTYIDLFAGIGGFRLAMANYSLKSRCLFASEINEEAARTYELNYGHKPLGDIRKVDLKELGFKSPEVVCGGFPCQTFSKGGQQAGFKDSRGTLFREIIRLIETYDYPERPKILILENVQNLINHDEGNTWKTIHHEISETGYNVIDAPMVVAPKDVGVPQLRNRAIILAVRKDIYNGKIDLKFERKKSNRLKLETIIQSNLTKQEIEDSKLSDEQLYILDCWDNFMAIIPKDERVIGFPIWSDEFGESYDISHFPVWKQNIIHKNRKLYIAHRGKIDEWFKKWEVKKKLTSTNRRFEWQAGKDIETLYDGIIQFRTSGIRVKRPTECPALVAIDHRPIYGPKRRFIAPIEALRLQSFPDDYKFDRNQNQLYKQLGNAVNVKVIESIFRLFIKFIDEKRGDKNE
jgi:DNA (cytosine-5)-methyltransferase 1